MRKLLAILFVLCLTVCVSMLFACGGDTPKDGGNTPQDGENQQVDNGLENFSGITLASKEVTYDGTEQSVEVAGELPDGATVTYTGNDKTDAGTYNVKAVVTCEGYNPLTLNATLKINKASYDMSEASWNYSNEYTYDGVEKVIEVSGLPDGVTVKAYSNNTQTNAGNYSASVTFNYDNKNYNEPTVAACTWSIAKAEITGVAIEDDTVDYDGNEHSLSIIGTLPTGVSVSYKYNGATASGVIDINNYTVTVTLSGANYIEKTLQAVLKIRKALNLKNLASTIVASFGSAPDPWQFIPDTQKKDRKILNSAIAYDSFVSVSSLPKNGIGKGLNAVYTVLDHSETALTYVNKLYAALTAIGNIYQEYINKNEDNYASFEGTYSVFGFKIVVSDEKYEILAKASGFAIEMVYDKTEEKITTRVDVADKLAAKYIVSDNYMRFAVNVFGVVTSDIEFVSSETKTTGVIYETTGVGSARLTTSAILEITDKYFKVIGNKGDFMVPGKGVNVEVYSNQTGNLIGTEVFETNTAVDYETVWFNLYNITGINTIKADMETKNGQNPNTVYINNSSTVFAQKFNTKLGIKTSRQYDIEFKKMYFYMDTDSDGKLEKVEQLIPMLFVQEANLNTYLSDMKSLNDCITVSPANTVSSSDFNTVLLAYDTYLAPYQEMKEALTDEITVEFIGTKNAWFTEN